MRTPFTILTLLTLSINAIGQVSNRLPINYTFSYINQGDDTVKCKRAQQSELNKLQSINGIDRLVGLQLATRIINIESILDEKRKGVDGYEKAFADGIRNLTTVLEQNGLALNLEEYENEFAYYKRHPVKSKAKLLQERNDRRQRMNDSIKFADERQKKINDSIEEVKFTIEQRRLNQQAIANQKKLEEKRKKEQQEYEKQQLARRATLIQKYGSVDGELIFNKKLKIGWTKEMCLESWGKPKEINRTTTLNGVDEQWVYSLKKYLYLSNDILKAIQD